jgi:hypothetical protein
MESGHDATGDILQVIPRRSSSGLPPDGGGSGSHRFSLPPERRRKLKSVVVGTLGACGLILVAAAIVHVAHPSTDTTVLAAAPTAAALPIAPAPSAAPVAPAVAAPPPPEVAQTGTLRLQRPAMAGKVWLDGQKITAASATVACGTHQLKVGSHGHAHSIDIPCGGELKISH